MNRATACLLMGCLALVFGCGPKVTVVYLREVPELDLSALDPYVEWGPAEISQDRMWVKLKGKAKADLGEALGVTVTRFTAQGRLDTVFAKVLEATAGTPEGTGPPQAPPEVDPDPPMRPPIIEDLITAGDEVWMDVDATTDKGVVTKLVFSVRPR